MAKVEKFEECLSPHRAYLQAAREIIGEDDLATIMDLMFSGNLEPTRAIEERAREIEAQGDG